ncbi:MAG: hypothetical protein LBM25_02420 [Bacteroidales bacterium]|jgi:hypothetical protein|nr:hypothetical protein [Bacteroidales bacterium]
MTKHKLYCSLTLLTIFIIGPFIDCSKNKNDISKINVNDITIAHLDNDDIVLHFDMENFKKEYLKLDTSISEFIEVKIEDFNLYDTNSSACIFYKIRQNDGIFKVFFKALSKKLDINENISYYLTENSPFLDIDDEEEKENFSYSDLSTAIINAMR